MIMTNNEVIKQAMEYRRNMLNLCDNEPIQDTFKLAEKAGFFIIATPLGNEFNNNYEYGFYKKIGSSKFIFINSTAYKATQNFTIWHEVYHSLFPFNKFEMDYERDEEQANIFSSNILIPTESLKLELSKNIINKKLYANEIHKVSLKYKMTYKAVLKHFFDIVPELKTHLGYLYSKSNERKYLTVSQRDELDELYEYGNKYLTKSIFEAIEDNHNKGIIDDDDLSRINAIIGEVFSIDSK
ncbi:ImmA/IrrE family metallo-endopeptidase [Mammaliicoccus sciuri]|uniref:ImmA/IrrE family metallo-endopeptidase n=1 Tax=Mammaliicoccus sciuri TaxID=1296 RepID=UPI002DB8FAC2|nr:ImmA/IrrE family metallo-endopeptidase [Mammaliicoccus sciuri]MEB6231177.1 ImmA/IrrE family metallo-endopeptidase [Mammaliicoccus sciuri]